MADGSSLFVARMHQLLLLLLLLPCLLCVLKKAILPMLALLPALAVGVAAAMAYDTFSCYGNYLTLYSQTVLVPS